MSVGNYKDEYMRIAEAQSFAYQYRVKFVSFWYVYLAKSLYLRFGTILKNIYMCIHSATLYLLKLPDRISTPLPHDSITNT